MRLLKKNTSDKKNNQNFIRTSFIHMGVDHNMFTVYK